MARPTLEQRSLLRGFERTAFAIADAVNTVPALKRATHAFLRTGGAAWVHYATRHLQRVWGLEHVLSLAPDRGVLLVSNHRSFFDMYVLSCVLLQRTSWVREMYFPVRGDFFYTSPAGVGVNAVMAAMAMYPPVLRQPERRAFNRYVVDFLSDALQRPGALVGYHPEGTRNKTDDPYTPLAASPGVGEIAWHARPIVLPAFVLGLGNNLPRQVASNFDRSGEPITLTFGAPVELDAFYARPGEPETFRAIASRLRDALVDLGARERSLRASEGLAPPRSARPRAPTQAAPGAANGALPFVSLAPGPFAGEAPDARRERHLA